MEKITAACCNRAENKSEASRSNNFTRIVQKESN